VDVSVTERISRRKYLRREMAELCSALIRAATEFPRDRKAKKITDMSERLSVPDEGTDVQNEWIASTGNVTMMLSCRFKKREVASGELSTKISEQIKQRKDNGGLFENYLLG